jgi:DNA-binding LytR/AlgR family response regulator
MYEDRLHYCTGATGGERCNAAAELQQAAQQAVMRFLSAFGEAAASRFLAAAPGAPAFGSAADAAAELQGCLQRLVEQQQRAREQQQQQQQQQQQRQ